MKEETIVGNFLKQSNPALYIMCEEIHLVHKELDIDLEVKNKLDNIDVIVINGVKFKKDKSE